MFSFHFTGLCVFPEELQQVLKPDKRYDEKSITQLRRQKVPRH
jgi:hypothetical protein